MQMQLNEDLNQDHKVEGGSNRAFGMTVGGILLAIAVYRFLFVDAASWGTGLLLLIGAPLVILGIIAPDLLAPLNQLWTKFGQLLFKIVNPLILGIVFFGVVTPTALIMRLVKADQLKLRFDPTAMSYWIKREPPGPQPDTMNDQF